MRTRRFKTVLSSLYVVFVLLCTVSVCFSVSTQQLDISHYEYGKIIIDGKTYTNDIVIWPNGEFAPGPDDMHTLKINDFDDFLESGYTKVLVATGDEGKVALDFSRKLKKQLKNKGIELQLIDTHEAVNFLNKTKNRDFVAFIHLNC